MHPFHLEVNYFSELRQLLWQINGTRVGCGAWEPLISTQSVRGTGDIVDLLLASEVREKGQSCRTETLTCGS